MKTCPICGQPLPADVHQNTKYCSDVCRKKGAALLAAARRAAMTPEERKAINERYMTAHAEEIKARKRVWNNTHRTKEQRRLDNLRQRARKAGLTVEEYQRTRSRRASKPPIPSTSKPRMPKPRVQKPTRFCPICGQPLPADVHRNTKYCSDACRRKGHSIHNSTWFATLDPEVRKAKMRAYYAKHAEQINRVRREKQNRSRTAEQKAKDIVRRKARIASMTPEENEARLARQREYERQKRANMTQEAREAVRRRKRESAKRRYWEKKGTVSSEE